MPMPRSFFPTKNVSMTERVEVHREEPDQQMPEETKGNPLPVQASTPIRRQISCPFFNGDNTPKEHQRELQKERKRRRGQRGQGNASFERLGENFCACDHRMFPNRPAQTGSPNSRILNEGWFDPAKLGFQRYRSSLMRKLWTRD